MKTIVFGFILNLFTLSTFAALDPIQEAEDLRNPNTLAITDGIKSKQANIRLQATVALGRIQSIKSADTLLQLLNDKSDEIQVEAVFALGQLGFKKEVSQNDRDKITDSLLVFMQSSHPKVQISILNALGKLSSSRALEILLPWSQNKNSQIRAAALWSSFRARFIQKLIFQPNPEPGLPAAWLQIFDKLKSDPNVDVRQAIAYHFVRFKDPKAILILNYLSRDKNSWVKLFAIQALSKLSGPNSSSVLVNASKDPHYNIRYAALQGLFTLKNADSVDFSRLLKDPSFHVRTAAAQIASLASDKKNILSKFLNDKSVSVKSQVIKSYVLAFPDQAVDFLKPYLKDPSWLIRQTAIENSDTKNESIFIDAMNDGDVHVRTAALEIISKIKSATAYQETLKALKSDELAIRGTAAQALLDRSESDIIEKGWDCYQNSKHLKWNELRESLVDLFSKNENSTTTQYLREILKDPSHSVSEKARSALISRKQNDLPELVPPALTFSPHRSLQFHSNPVVVLETSKGKIEIECYSKQAPIHVANFVGLVKSGFYNGLLWHRVVPNFVIQGGDPDGTGWGDAGFSLRAEINHTLFERGTLAMPRSSGFDTGGVQLFLNHIPTPHLDGQYTVFGKVKKGLDVIDNIEVGDFIKSAKIK